MQSVKKQFFLGSMKEFSKFDGVSYDKTKFDTWLVHKNTASPNVIACRISLLIKYQCESIFYLSKSFHQCDLNTKTYHSNKKFLVKQMMIWNLSFEGKRSV